MPFYGFHSDIPLPAWEIAARIRAMTREPRGFFDSWKLALSSEPPVVPFVGKVNDRGFRITRAIQYHNSFLPLVWGRIVPAPGGSQFRVTMFLHPLVALFMLFWLSFAGREAWLFLIYPERGGSIGTLFSAGMFIFGVALTLWGFIPEAIKAKRLLLEGLSG